MELQTISSVAHELGLSRDVVSYLLDFHEIPTHPVPTNGKARGIDADGVRTLKQFAKPSKSKAKASA